MTDAFFTSRSTLLTEPLLLTKLHTSTPSLHLVSRPRLLTRLEEAMKRKLTLLSAPAGSGKTTLLTTWLASFRDREVPCAWLSLDEGDNDPTRFWRYVSTALESLHPGRENDLMSALQTPPMPCSGVLLPHLINVLSMLSRSFVLVLDDYHLKTSILNGLSGSLCNAVTEGTDSQVLLEQLEQRNLFVVPLDHERCWYRYHHLFADVLKRRLSTEHHQSSQYASPSRLHRRASHWYEQHQLLAEAIRHALAAEAFDRAAQLCEQMMHMTFARGELPTLLSWFAALPATVLRRHPHLCLLYLRVLILFGRLQAAYEQLEEAERGLREQSERFTSEERRTFAGELTLAHALLTLLQGDLALTRELCLQAQHLLPQNHLMRGGVPFLLGVAHWLNGEFAQASAHLYEVSKIGRATDSRYFASMACFFLAQTRAAQGHLQEGLKLCCDAFGMTTPLCGGLRVREKSLDLAGTALSTSIAGRFLLPRESGRASLALLLYEQNDLEEAERCVQPDLTLGQAEGNVFDVINGKILLSRIRQACGDVQEAHNLMQQALALAQQYDVSWTWAIPSVTVSAIRLALAQGNYEVVAQWAQACRCEAVSPLRPATSRGVEELMLARVCLALGQHEEALSRLSWLYTEAMAAGRGRQVLEILVLQALVEHAQGEAAQAFSTLASVLKLAAREGYIRLFVDEGAPMADLLQQLQAAHDTTPAFVDTLLAAFPLYEARGEIPRSREQPPTTMQPLPEPLTEREREILRLMATGTTNQEIANHLVIAVSTAKRHVSNILGKLGASSRTQAVAHARERGLL